MSVITISRQLGSMGCEIAQVSGTLLGYRVVWRDLINQAARRAGVPGVALATIDELGLLDVHPTKEEHKAYHQALSQVMQELAHEGNVVIVGRAGQVILQDWEDVYHIRIIAPAALRASRLMEAQQITLEAAQAQIHASDHARKTFLRQNYRVDWESPDFYDLIINTAHLNVQAAARIICRLVSPADFPSSTSQPTDSCIE